jgi:peptidoglycan hydrolase-like protein with peptidoglycan-binding domain
MALTIQATVTPTGSPTLTTPQILQQKAFEFTDVRPGPFDVLGITLPRLKGDVTGLQFVGDAQFFHVAGGTLRLNLVQEVLIANTLSQCNQTVVMQHERGHVQDNEQLMPQMDRALRADEQFNLIMVQGQEFPVSQSEQVKAMVHDRVEAVFSDLTLKKVKQRDTVTEYKRMQRQITMQCTGTPAKLLQRGTVGHGVAEAQIALNAHLMGSQAPLGVDGVFGPKTDTAVRDFQRRNGLVADGVIGPKTRKALGMS